MQTIALPTVHPGVPERDGDLKVGDPCWHPRFDLGTVTGVLRVAGKSTEYSARFTRFRKPKSGLTELARNRPRGRLLAS